MTNILHDIDLSTLICMNDLDAPYFEIDLAYARADNTLFGERIYRADAQLWLHKDLADIVALAAQRVHDNCGAILVLYDGLRSVDAQHAMLKTQRVQDNPQWLEAPRLLSPPGSGAHPRAMAIDVSIRGADGALLDMGTPFDYLADNPDRTHNPAHRDYAHDDVVMQNRALLDDAMMGAAKELNIDLYPLPQEWWDYRLPIEIYGAFAPLREDDLPPAMRVMD